MGAGIFSKLLSNLEAVGEKIPDLRRAAGNLRYRVLDGGVLLALDGVWYHSSKEIFCKHCPHMTDKNGETSYYYHSAAAGAIVKPGSGAVLPDGGTNTEWEDRGSYLYEQLGNEQGGKRR